MSAQSDPKKSSRRKRGRAYGMEEFSDSDSSESESDDEVPSQAPVLGPSSTPDGRSITPETPADAGIRTRVTGERGGRGMFLPRVPDYAWNNAATSNGRLNAATRPRRLVIPTGIDPAADSAARNQLPG